MISEKDKKTEFSLMLASSMQGNYEFVHPNKAVTACTIWFSFQGLNIICLLTTELINWQNICCSWSLVKWTPLNRVFYWDCNSSWDYRRKSQSGLERKSLWKDWDCHEQRSHTCRVKVDQEGTDIGHEEIVIFKDGNWFPVERENMEILATEN